MCQQRPRCSSPLVGAVCLLYIFSQSFEVATSVHERRPRYMDIIFAPVCVLLNGVQRPTRQAARPADPRSASSLRCGRLRLRSLRCGLGVVRISRKVSKVASSYLPVVCSNTPMALSKALILRDCNHCSNKHEKARVSGSDRRSHPSDFVCGKESLRHIAVEKDLHAPTSHCCCRARDVQKKVEAPIFALLALTEEGGSRCF